MHIRVRSLRSAAWLLLLLSFVVALPAAWAQHGLRLDPQALAERTGRLDEVFETGGQLERQRRWSEALAHYERAIRDFPGDEQLERRLTRVRLHYDCARRYADSSFVRSVGQMTRQQSMGVYVEVLQKIRTYYVDQPRWERLVDYGLQGFEAALSEPAFVQLHGPGRSTEELERLRERVRRTVHGQRVSTWQDAERLVGQVAELAERQVGIRPAATVLEFTCGAAALDEYSALLTTAQLDDVFSQIEGNFVGLGIELRLENDCLRVVQVIPGSPAASAGLGPGFRIDEVDGQTVAAVSAETAADMLKGLEGTRVELVVRSPDGQTNRMALERRRVDVPSVQDARIIDPPSGTAYLRIASFQRSTGRDVETALWSLYEDGMKALVIDIRGNPGGLLDAAVEVADKFIGSEEIVSTRGREWHENRIFHAKSAGTWRVPLVVLIDADSASASEIFAGAIRDHQRGTVVGQRSYGKGSVQGIFELNNSRIGLRLTTARFYTPSGAPISRRGVTPHLVVHVAAKPLDDGHVVADEADDTLDAALDLVRQQFAQHQPRERAATTVGAR